MVALILNLGPMWDEQPTLHLGRLTQLEGRPVYLNVEWDREK
jgi:hypothetical protein